MTGTVPSALCCRGFDPNSFIVDTMITGCKC